MYEKIKELESLLLIKNINRTMLEKINKQNVKKDDIVIFDYSFGKDVFSLGFITDEDNSGRLELRSTSSGWRCDFNDKIPLYKFKISLQTLTYGAMSRFALQKCSSYRKCYWQTCL